MARTRLGIPTLTAGLALALGMTAAHGQESVPVAQAEGSGLWFVELSGAPAADGGRVSNLRNEKAAFRRSAAQAGIKFQERFAYDTLFNGFSVAIGQGDLARLAQLEGVKAVYPVDIVAAPTPEEVAGSLPDLTRAIGMTGASIAQDRGYTGRGVKVGIIDSGVDFDHPAFGGSGINGGTEFPTARVAFGWDFVGDAYDANPGNATYSPIPQPDPNPDDCGGHGTHVAGIVGANGAGIVGVAPDVTLGAYRVFGCTGSSSADVIVAALERALADGMDVVNMSLGAPRQWPQYPTAQASTRLVNKGVVVVASIGNSGPGGSSPDGLFAAGAPGVGKKVIGVASFTNGQAAFLVNGVPYGFTPATGSPLPPTSGSLPLARTGTTTTNDDACTSLPPGSLNGAAVLIRRGTCSFYIKASNAMNAGAAAVILYNNASGTFTPTVAGTPPITIPVVAVTNTQGADIDAAIAAGSATLQWSNLSVGWPFGAGGLISGFSSFGLAADLSLKPNIGAPGGSIFSTYPLERGGSATLSGTSMSAPHVAGGVALVLEANPRISSNAMMGRLQNAAQPKMWNGNAALGFLDNVHRQGAGMLDIIGVIDATTTVSPSEIAVGESEHGPRSFTLTVKNASKHPVTYAVAHVPALATGPNNQAGSSYAPTGYLNAPATVEFDAASVNVAAGGSASIGVSIDANAGLPDRSIYGGYIVITPDDGSLPVRVPFAGFKGDYQATQVLTPTANGFPWLATLSGTSYSNRPVGATYTLQEGDVPYVLLHLDHLSRRLRIEAFDAVTGRAWHRVLDNEYVGRNSTPGGFFAYSWDGTTFRGNGRNANQWVTVPNGQYVLRVSVLKALGDDNNPDHWETWTSPVITIARP